MSDPQLPPGPASPPPGPPTEPLAVPTVDAPLPTVEATDATEPAPASPTTNVRSWLVAGGVAAALAIGAGFVLGGGDDGGSTADAADAAETAQAGAAPGGDQVVNGGPVEGGFLGQATSGTISAVDDGTLTVEGDDGTTTTVETDDDTVVRETTEGSVDDLAEGDNVLVVGDADDDGTVTAENVVDNGDAELTIAGGPDGAAPPGDVPDGQELPTPPAGTDDGPVGPGGARGFPTAGEITSLDGDTLTVETADGETVTVTLTDETAVSVTQDLSVDDLEEGDDVRVMGDADDDDVVTASVIQLGDATFAGPMGGPPGAAPTGDVVTGATDSGAGL